MYRLIVFVLGSLAILYLSRDPLRSALRGPRSHGFYRFFAFEAILGLAVLNVVYWFDDPFSPRQIVAWISLTASGFLVIHGVYLLRVVGQPQGSFEDTTALVTVGAFKYIRHPLYASLLYLALGTFLKKITPLTSVLALVAILALVATARVEEGENRKRFGALYAEYMQKTKMFIPFLF